ncbi:MAG: cupin domain-containing protein [Chromatocurvus sp.]
MFQLTGQGTADGLMSAVIAGAVAITPAALQASEAGSGIPTADQVVEQLGLEAHVEGGFFRRTYAAEERPTVATPQGDRYLMSSIFYLLTSQSPVGHFHRNRSDIVHYFHLGDPVTYYLLQPDGSLQTAVMGSDVLAGQKLQLTVPGGVWKASRLSGGTHGYGLISEAVAPGFDYADMTLADRSALQSQFPAHRSLISALTRAETAADTSETP